MLVLDNSRTFTSDEFKNFLESNGIKHKHIAPCHPTKNDLAEHFVQILKQALRKLNVTNRNIKANLQRFLFQYRITPHPELNKSPVKAMFNRKLRSRLDLMFPKEDLDKKNNRKV